jgi:hypothetical protein
MGALQAQEFAAMDVDLSTAIGWHLRGNHYPPIPIVMVQPCIEAIDAYHDGDLDRLIPLPFDGVDRNGEPFQIRWRNGEAEAPARALIEHAHLYAWCVEDEDY